MDWDLPPVCFRIARISRTLLVSTTCSFILTALVPFLILLVTVLVARILPNFRPLQRSMAEHRPSNTASHGTGHHAPHHKAFEVIPVPVLSDNYAYVLVDKHSKQAAAVDPADPWKVADVIKANNLTLRAVFTTHHHADHSQGNPEMVKMFPGIAVYGGDARVPAMTHTIAGKSTNKPVPADDKNEFQVSVFSVPCHTTGHLLYHISAGAGDNDAIFTGDTVFSGGCGRFFEGTAAQMFYNLCTVTASFAPATRVYVGHEYTVKNMLFALAIEPENPDYKQALAEAQSAVAQGKPTVPSTVAREEPSVAAALSMSVSDPVAVLGELRKRKDKF